MWHHVGVVSRSFILAKMVLASLLAALSFARGPADEPARIREIAERVLARVQEARVAAGARALERRAVLDLVAGERARAVAALAPDRRLADPWDVGTALEQEGVVRWKRTWHRLALITGPDLVDRLAEQWVSLDEAWTHATDAGTSAAGVAGAQAADGTFVFVAVLVEDLPPVPDPAVVERAVLGAINEIRAQHGLAELTPDATLSRIARAHSKAMRADGFFDHRDSHGRGPADRLQAAGYRYRKVAENLEFNHREEDPAAIAADHWMASPGHRRNILAASHQATGVGVALAEDGSVWITQLFVTP